MEKVLILSSRVAAGHVGLSAGEPVLQALGVPVTGLPTILLSNHPGFAHAAGMAVPVETLQSMADALAENGWLADHAALLLGYLPSVAHVHFAAALAARMGRANPRLRLVVDPVLGDHPKGLYVPAAVAGAVRDILVPMADMLTPNRFELEFLTGRRIATLAEARAAAGGLAPRVLVTSPPVPANETGVLEVADGRAALYPAGLRGDVPHGVGDAFAAMIAAGLPAGAALGHLDRLIAESAGAPHLNIVGARALWTAASPVAARAAEGD